VAGEIKSPLSPYRTGSYNLRQEDESFIFLFVCISRPQF
jgi:hypothetical protein